MSGESSIHLEIVVPNHKRYLSLIGNIAEQVARALEDYTGDREALAFHLNLVLTEAMVNVMEHSSPSEQCKTVRVCIGIENNALCIRVYDHGQGFDIDAISIPNFETLNERGRGIFLMRSLMDNVAYRRTESGNVLEMYKKLD